MEGHRWSYSKGSSPSARANILTISTILCPGTGPNDIFSVINLTQHSPLLSALVPKKICEIFKTPWEAGSHWQVSLHCSQTLLNTVQVSKPWLVHNRLIVIYLPHKVMMMLIYPLSPVKGYWKQDCCKSFLVMHPFWNKGRPGVSRTPCGIRSSSSVRI